LGERIGELRGEGSDMMCFLSQENGARFLELRARASLERAAMEDDSTPSRLI
jgi:hypothetical protein